MALGHPCGDPPPRPTPIPCFGTHIMDATLRRRSFLKALSAAAAAPLVASFMETDSAFAQELARLSGHQEGPGFPHLAGEYLLDPGVTYLNHASIGTVPAAVHRAGLRYRGICEENPWLYIWGGAWEEAREEVRAGAARLLGCDPVEVAITHNTTESFNVLAQGLPLGPGDEVLFSSLNHAGAAVCWEHYAETKGYSVRSFDFPMADIPAMTASDVVRIHQEEIRPETRVLVLPHMDNIVGLRHPLAELTRMARENGVEFVLVDGAQSAGMIPLDLKATGVDAFAASPHKWVQSVKGLGIFYLRRELLETVRPFWVTWGRDRWRGTARAFEDYGTRDLPEVLSLGDALDFQRALGEEQKVREYRRLFRVLKEMVEGTPGLEWKSPDRWEMGSILVAVGLGHGNAGEVSQRIFRDGGIVVRPFPTPGLNSLRVSPNLMNTQEELDHLFRALEG